VSSGHDPFAALEQAASRQSLEQQAARVISGARVRLILGRDAKSAFFGTLVLRLRPEPSWEIDTLATDGRVLQYHPSFVTGLSPDELVGVLAHEVMHCALAHPARRGTRDLVQWNVACDLAINPLLIQAGIVLPASRLFPGEGSYAGLKPGLAADVYYAALPHPEPSTEAAGEGSRRASDPGGCGQVLDAAQGNPAESRQIEADWQVALSQARDRWYWNRLAAAGRVMSASSTGSHRTG
jgi:predicted metal-dependent peptidase